MVSSIRTISVGAALVAGLTACSSTSDGQNSSTSAGVSSSASSSETMSTHTATPQKESSTSEASSGKDIVNNPPQASWQDALNKAQEKFDGKPAKIELEHDDSGALVYKIELISGMDKHAVQYSAEDLTEISDKEKTLDDGEDQNKAFDIGDVVSLDQAVATAREHTAGDITSWKIEGKDTGRVQYEFDILPSGAEDDVEVQVDALDGSLIK